MNGETLKNGGNGVDYEHPTEAIKEAEQLLKNTPGAASDTPLGARGTGTNPERLNPVMDKNYHPSC